MKLKKIVDAPSIGKSYLFSDGYTVMTCNGIKRDADKLNHYTLEDKTQNLVWEGTEAEFFDVFLDEVEATWQ